MNEILKLSGVAQARLIREGQISSTELIEAHLSRIQEVNPSLNAVIEVLGDSARAEAAAVDKRRAGGEALRPYEGVPFSIKDSIEVKGTVCSAGTLGFRNNPPATEDAVLVARLKNAGAIPLARTNLPDLLFAFESDNLIFGRTNNPHDPTRTSGGSSGGEAALIAACGSPFGLGSDAAGSVRLPAHYCGIAAIKPTSGRLSRKGHVPPAGGWIEALWQIGPMARHIEDLQTLMPLLAVGQPIMAAAAFPGGHPKARIAFFTDNGIMAADEDTKRVVHEAARALSAAGHHLTEIRPPAIDRAYDLEMKFIGPDGGDGLRAYLKQIGSHQTHPLLEGWLSKLEAYRTDLAGFAAYWAELDQYRAEMNAFLEDFDAILSPVSATPAVPHGHSIRDDVFPGYSYTMAHNLTGWPAVSVPAGKSKTGLPIGVQIATGPLREDLALTLAAATSSEIGRTWKPELDDGPAD
jgi:amidase